MKICTYFGFQVKSEWILKERQELSTRRRHLCDYCNYCTLQLCIASSESSNMSFMSAVRVVEYLDSAITAAVELVAVRGCPADEGGHGTGHVTRRTRGPEAASLPQYCVILSFYLLSSRYFLFLIIRLVCFYLNTYERTLQDCRKTLMSRS